MWVSRKNTTLKRTKGQGWGSSPRHLLILYTCQLNSWGRNIKKQTNRKKKHGSQSPVPLAQTVESNHCTQTVQLRWKKCPSPTSSLQILSYSAPEKKKAIPIDRTLCYLYFFLVCLKIFPNYQFYEEQKTREGAGILINFSADTMFNLRLYFHF